MEEWFPNFREVSRMCKTNLEDPAGNNGEQRKAAGHNGEQKPYPGARPTGLPGFVLVRIREENLKAYSWDTTTVSRLSVQGQPILKHQVRTPYSKAGWGKRTFISPSIPPLPIYPPSTFEGFL